MLILGMAWLLMILSGNDKSLEDPHIPIVPPIAGSQIPAHTAAIQNTLKALEPLDKLDNSQHQDGKNFKNVSIFLSKSDFTASSYDISGILREKLKRDGFMNVMDLEKNSRIIVSFDKINQHSELTGHEINKFSEYVTKVSFTMIIDYKEAAAHLSENIMSENSDDSENKSVAAAVDAAVSDAATKFESFVRQSFLLSHSH